MPSSSKKAHYLKYEGNNSKKWDGQKISVDGEWLNHSELAEGQMLSFLGREREAKSPVGMLLSSEESEDFSYAIHYV